MVRFNIINFIFQFILFIAKYEKLKAKVFDDETLIAKLMKEKSQLTLSTKDITTAGNTNSTLIDSKYILYFV